ncbi:hypothetical protein BD560DRAFT_399474 [Blakeslea trispora]|nr:hypothetical protein BD560DRAFT_399474 [Blakeslea trispora]
MLSILHLVAYGATGLAFCFGIFSLACGLYYLAELVEKKNRPTFAYLSNKLLVFFSIG